MSAKKECIFSKHGGHKSCIAVEAVRDLGIKISDEWSMQICCKGAAERMHTLVIMAAIANNSIITEHNCLPGWKEDVKKDPRTVALIEFLDTNRGVALDNTDYLTHKELRISLFMDIQHLNDYVLSGPVDDDQEV